MQSRKVLAIAALSLFGVASSAAPLRAAETPKKEPPKQTQVWTDPAAPDMPVDFRLQGEYTGESVGVQVIALGGGAFQAVEYSGGLPGDGWDGKSKSLLVGKLEDGKVALKPAEGKRKYLAQNPDEFSATSKFPPEGHKPMTGEIATDGASLMLKGEGGHSSVLKKIQRQSPTLGMKAPESAKVLFDGTNKDKFNGGELDEKHHVLNTKGQDIVSKDKFLNYTMHIEFMLAYRPEARGQGRGNSGFYQVDLYEVQILDSFGLDGKNNECGGIYTKAEPLVNMCLPPLQWQTYDVEFHSAEVGPDGKKTKNARVTVKHNGVVIHDNREIDGKTGGARNEPEGTPGPIKLQGHGNPTQFRNIWIVEKK